MAIFNSVISGNVGSMRHGVSTDKNGEERHWASFTVGVNKQTFNRESKSYENDDTMWVSCSAFGNLAKRLVDCGVDKGTPVIVSGYHKANNYTDKNGNEINNTNLIAESIGLDIIFGTVEYVGGSGSKEGGSAKPARSEKSAKAKSAAAKSTAKSRKKAAPKDEADDDDFLLDNEDDDLDDDFSLDNDDVDDDLDDDFDDDFDL